MHPPAPPLPTGLILFIIVIISIVHVSLKTAQFHMLGKVPFAVQSWVLKPWPVDKVRHTQLLQVQLQLKEIIILLIT